MENIEDFYPLTPMQEGMLFHTLFAPQSGVYVTQLNCALRGDVNFNSFERAWQTILARHQILRTSYVWEEVNKPIQVVHRQVKLPVEYLQWTGFSKSEQKAKITAYLQSERIKGFDLSEAPLMRVTLIKLDEESYQFLWSFHHLLLDAWSVPIVLNEVVGSYTAYSEGQEPRLPRCRPFRDYIVWLQRQDMSQAEAFWKSTLKGFTAPTPLALARPRESETDNKKEYADKVLNLSVEQTTELQKFARQNKLTMNTLVQGAWALLLSRYSGESDVAFGTAVSGRPPELEGSETIVGLLLNTLIVRTEARAEMRLLDWLKGLQEQQVKARQYEYAPLVQVQGWSEIARGIPLFESLLVFDNAPMNIAEPQPEKQRQGKLEIEKFEAIDQTNLPLSVEIKAGQRLALYMRYDCGWFDQATIARMLDHFKAVLADMVARPESKLGELSVLADEERRKILIEWNATKREYQLDQSAHEAFEAQVARTPQAIAVTFENRSLTYDQLNRQANRLAGVLVDEGVGPDTVVALLDRRGINLLTAIMAVFKAGGAYLPLDPNYPPARLMQVLDQSNSRLVITTSEFTSSVFQALANAPAGNAPRVLHIERLFERNEGEANLPSRSAPNNLAYVIYTSGSTGVPKGAMVEHKGMLNHLWAKVEDLRLSQTDCVAQTASQCFDISVWQMLAALLVGGRVHIFNDDVAHHPSLVEASEKESVSILEIVPSLLRAVLDEPERLKDKQSLRWLLLTGEALPPELIREWFEFCPNIPLMNAYGPTECSDDVTHCAIYERLNETAKVTPIGRAIANTQLYILDSRLQPVPIGVAGQLYVGGVGVGRGYLNKPELTGDVFIPDPFTAIAGARMYRTGDLVRYLPDGNIEFLGRIDYQVKIRGFRIELGEIESAVGKHPQVRESVVVVREEADGEKHLVAYCVADQEPVSADELRSFLKERLPHYMIPGVFVMLEALPLTPNGKVDRRALPAPGELRPETERAFVAPRDTLEQELAQIWESVLGIRPIGVTDNFFDLGGHSLIAVRLMAQVQKRFERSIPLANLLQGGTIEHLANSLRQQSQTQDQSPLVAIEAGGFKRPLFCIHPIGGQVLCYVELSRALGADQPFFGLQAPGLAEAGDYVSIEDMARHYLKAVRDVQPEGPYLLSGYSFGGVVAFEMSLQLLRQNQQTAFLGMFDTWSPIIHRVMADDAYLLYELALDRAIQNKKQMPLSLELMRAMGHDELVDYALRETKRAGLVPEEIEADWLSQFLRGYKARRIALQNYKPGVYSGRVTLFKAPHSDPHFVKELQSVGINADDPTMYWAEYCSNPIEIEMVSGRHENMMQQPHVQMLAERVQASLRKASSFSSAG